MGAAILPATPTAEWPAPSAPTTQMVPSLPGESGDPTEAAQTSWIDSLAYPRSPIFDDPTSSQGPGFDEGLVAGSLPDGLSDDPFERAARRQQITVRPEGGRQEGPLTVVLE